MEVVEQAFRYGAFDFVPKPLDRDRLICSVILRSKRTGCDAGLKNAACMDAAPGGHAPPVGDAALHGGSPRRTALSVLDANLL